MSSHLMQLRHVLIDICSRLHYDWFSRSTGNGIVMREFAHLLENIVKTHSAEAAYTFDLIYRLGGSPIPDSLCGNHILDGLCGPCIVPDQLLEIRSA